MEEIIMSIIVWLKDLSYIGIVLALSFEAIPGEIVLPLAGYWVSKGDFVFWLTVLAGVVGGVTGPLTLYALGRFGGRPMILKYGKYFLIKEQHVNQADHFFEKYGAKVAFFGRFIPVVRSAISIPCGLAKMNVWTFIGYTTLGVIPITYAYVYLGFKLGENWERASVILEPYFKVIAILLAAGITVAVLYKLHKKKRESREKKAA